MAQCSKGFGKQEGSVVDAGCSRGRIKEREEEKKNLELVWGSGWHLMCVAQVVQV